MRTFNPKEKIVNIATIEGGMQAELLRSILREQGIPCEFIQEAKNLAFGLSEGPFARNDLYVAEKDAEAARRVVEDFLAGGQTENSEK